MSAVKERIIGALTIMSETDAQRLWAFIQASLTPKDWTDIEEVEPTKDEIVVIKAYKSGDPDYQPVYTYDQVMKELGLQ